MNTIETVDHDEQKDGYVNPRNNIASKSLPSQSKTSRDFSEKLKSRHTDVQLRVKSKDAAKNGGHSNNRRSRSMENIANIFCGKDESSKCKSLKAQKWTTKPKKHVKDLFDGTNLTSAVSKSSTFLFGVAIDQNTVGNYMV